MYHLLHKWQRYYAYVVTAVCRRPFFNNIGSRTIMYSPLRIVNPQNITIGDRVVIERNATLYSVASYRDKSYNGKISIGNNVYINYGFNATSASEIVIEDDVLIAFNVSIFDFDHDYRDIDKNINQTDLVVKGRVVVGEKTWLGMNVAILGNVKIGKHCVIAANSVVTKDIPDYSVAAGNPLKIIKRYNTATKQWEGTH
jgi:acetyltransferase-like isoleucine patch superfamily enzyme